MTQEWPSLPSKKGQILKGTDESAETPGYSRCPKRTAFTNTTAVCVVFAKALVWEAWRANPCWSKGAESFYLIEQATTC